VTLVAPSQTRICAGTGGSATPPYAGFPCDGATQFSDEGGVSTLTLTFVPEPSSVLLIAAGLAGLAFLGRRKRS
jgi:hypothetical protein